ncbi:MAG: PGF-pre-PGF domain-containing protein [Methanocorpusculum sp.]|nr:PGF-pre-PGF domain-containing protein [Methanocorpusculum sp.]
MNNVFRGAGFAPASCCVFGCIVLLFFCLAVSPAAAVGDESDNNEIMLSSDAGVADFGNGRAISVVCVAESGRPLPYVANVCVLYLKPALHAIPGKKTASGRVWANKIAAVPPFPGGEDTGSGHYAEYLRTVTNGGYISFGTSTAITGVTLPDGVSGMVTLKTEPDAEPPADKKPAVLFAISASLAGTAADGTLLTEKDIPAVIAFNLTEAEIEAAGYTMYDVVLYHFKDGVWVLCGTYVEEVKDGIVYYTADTDGFSPFAVVYETSGTGAPVGIETPTVTIPLPVILPAGAGQAAPAGTSAG